MHMLHALVGRAFLRPRRRHPLDDPLDAPEWAGLWRVFAWRAQFGRWWRARRAARHSASRTVPVDSDSSRV